MFLTGQARIDKALAGFEKIIAALEAGELECRQEASDKLAQQIMLDNERGLLDKAAEKAHNAAKGLRSLLKGRGE